MVVAQPTPPSICQEKLRDIELPIIDLLTEKSQVSKLIVKACEDFGFFKVINHGVPEHVIKAMEDESYGFFSKPASQKQRAGPANPYGYGCKNIGFNGDYGEVEYLLLHTKSISQRSKTISSEPTSFRWVHGDRCAVNCYVEAVRELACEILELMATGLRVPDTSFFSNFLRDSQSDSLLRLNHYPPLLQHPLQQLLDNHTSAAAVTTTRIGFGEHTDPQIFTILRSNDVSGLQICTHDGFWLPVPPDPNEFYVFVGDAFQALTNGRFTSVRHRALANSCKSRMSMMYFAAPPLDAWINAPPQMKNISHNIYRPFTWGEFKQTVYSLRLADNRLDHFKSQSQ